MTRQEFLGFMSAINAFYPGRVPEEMSSDETLEAWYGELKDLDAKVAAVILKNHVAKSPFPPTLSDILGTAYDIQACRTNWSEKWVEVLRAIGKYGYRRESEALESLDDFTRRVVKKIGWRDLCLSEESQIGFIRKDFQKVYEQQARSDRDQALLSDEVREFIDIAKQIQDPKRCLAPHEE